MNLDRVREKVLEHVGKHTKFIYKGSRNQKEEFMGVIIKCFSHIFIIKTDSGQIKSFTYNDFIIKTIRMMS